MTQESGYLVATMDSIDDVRAELAGWSGTAASLWSYTATHSVLTVRLERQGVKENLHVDCLGVLSLSGRVGGSGVNFVIEETTRPRGRGAGRIPVLHLKDISQLGISLYCEILC
jgi:hypothetical protein